MAACSRMGRGLLTVAVMIDQTTSSLTILRRRQVEARTGLARATIYDRIRRQTFPAPVRLGGGRAVGWLASEIDDWIAQRVAESRTRTPEHREMSGGGSNAT